MHRRHWQTETTKHPPVLGITERDWDGSWWASRIDVEGVCDAAEEHVATEDEARAAVRRMLTGLGEIRLLHAWSAPQGLRNKPPPEATSPPRWARRS